MTKKEYITPEIEGINTEIEDVLTIGTGTNSGGDEEITDPGGFGAKEWPYTFNEDDPEP